MTCEEKVSKDPKSTHPSDPGNPMNHPISGEKNREKEKIKRSARCLGEGWGPCAAQLRGCRGAHLIEMN